MNTQLSFEVSRHAQLRESGQDGILIGSLKIAGDFAVSVDLDSGDQLTVHVADADGNVIATAVAEVGGVGFAPIKDKDMVVGTERQHKAKVTG